MVVRMKKILRIDLSELSDSIIKELIEFLVQEQIKFDLIELELI